MGLTVVLSGLMGRYYRKAHRDLEAQRRGALKLITKDGQGLGSAPEERVQALAQVVHDPPGGESEGASTFRREQGEENTRLRGSGGRVQMICVCCL